MVAMPIVCAKATGVFVAPISAGLLLDARSALHADRCRHLHSIWKHSQVCGSPRSGVVRCATTARPRFLNTPVWHRWWYMGLQAGMVIMLLFALVQTLLHSGTTCAAPQWLALAGSMCPVIAVLNVLQKPESTPKAMRSRLHTALVLAALLATVFFLGLSRHLSALGAGKSAVEGLAVTASMVCVVVAGLGAKIYLPFDLPTALSAWFLPRGGIGGWRSSTLPERMLSVSVLAGLVDMVTLLTSSSGRGANSLLVVKGFRAAMSLVAVVILSIMRDVSRKRRSTMPPSRQRDMTSLSLGIDMYTSALVLGLVFQWRATGWVGPGMVQESLLAPSAGIWLCSSCATLFARVHQRREGGVSV